MLPEPFIVGTKVVLIVAAVLLSGYEVWAKRGRSAVAWAVLALALVLFLR